MNRRTLHLTPVQPCPLPSSKKGRVAVCLTLFLFLLLCALPASAQQKQKFSVASFEADPTDMTAREGNTKKIDGNGDLYAIIKVTSNYPDDDLRAYLFNFGYLNHFVELHDDELWVYVQRNAKTVTIRREGYTTINKYDLQTTIEPGKVYNMMLSVKAAPVARQWVRFNVTPADSRARITYRSTAPGAVKEVFGDVDATGSLAKSLPLGTYDYEVTAADYHLFEGRITLKERNQTLVEDVVLKSNVAEVTLNAPAEADIYIEGELMGRGSWTGNLHVGTHAVECQQANHRSTSQFITVQEGQSETITLTPPTPITGTLAISSRPLDAVVSVDGQRRGVTPCSIDLMIGQHNVSVSKDGYATTSQSFDIKENEVTELELKLEATKVKKPKPVDKPKQKTVANTVSSLVPSTCGYAQGVFQVGSLMAVGASVGGYLGNFNVEASYLFGLSKSEDIYWTNTAGNNILCSYKPSVMGLKVGYGFAAGRSFRLTPQVGCNIVNISDNGSKGNATAATIGLRAEYAPAAHFMLFAAPEFGIALNKSDIYKQLADISSDIKSWADGFNVRVGLCVSF